MSSENDPRSQSKDSSNTPIAPPLSEYDQQPAPKVPDAWPGAWGAYKFSRDGVKYNLGVYLLLLLVPFLLSMTLGIFKVPETTNNIVGTIVSIFFSIALIIVILGAFRGKKVDGMDALKQSFSLLAVKYFFLGILLWLIAVGSLLLLIIPFFFIMPRLILAPYYLVDKQLDIMASINASWKETKGHVGKVYGIIGASIAITLLFFTIIGIPFAIYFLIMYSAATPLLYLYIQKQGPSEAIEATESIN